MKEELSPEKYISSIEKIIGILWVILLLVVVLLGSVFIDFDKIRQHFLVAKKIESENPKASIQNDYWAPPDSTAINLLPEAELIKYGRQLIANTSHFLGPKGTVAKSTNGMNCQNCHLDAGTKIFGNNYSAVASTYPKFRGRSGTYESIEKRVNDCFERSLNGQALKHDSKEMKAIVSYIKWVGSNVKKGEPPKGSGLVKITLLDRPASPENGKVLYADKCSTCHGKDGQGVLKPSGDGYTYPPLWGENSYNWGAGLYRLSTFAGYIKANMPLGATIDAPQLTDEECWDLAAYINSLPRPKMDLSHDWPDISKKPFDHPFGPFADTFSASQHKFGPFKPIVEKK